MIQIQIPKLIPEILRNEGTQKKVEYCKFYEKYKKSYDQGKKTFEFLNIIYGSVTVKDVLKNAHHKKCCYCESIFDATSYGAVEHYRPKGAVILRKKSKKKYPGYYWLAYEWENLLYICERCNTNKGSYFPLQDDSKQARNHNDQIANESPLFIHPAIDDPKLHISFRGDAIFGLSENGIITIESLYMTKIS
jgi:uncharacterized protein (TIGR02646 family)